MGLKKGEIQHDFTLRLTNEKVLQPHNYGSLSTVRISGWND